MTATPLELRHTYRHLYRALLRAVLYSKPARYVARDRLRNAFRNGVPADFEPAKIERTLELLEGARRRGTEHTLVKNLLRVWGEQTSLQYRGTVERDILQLRKRAYGHFDRTVARLNESMGLCIK